MKCPNPTCGKEIPRDEEEYHDVGGEKILLPCRECLEKIKDQISSHPRKKP
jgi:hypothetical protein